MQLWTPLEKGNLNSTLVNVPEFKFPGGRQQSQAKAEKRRPQPVAWKQQMVGCMRGFNLVRTPTKISSHCVTDSVPSLHRERPSTVSHIMRWV